MLLVPLLTLVLAQSPPASCPAAKDYGHKSDLPDGALAAMGQPMADIAEPFNASDVVSGDSPPQRRFISAHQDGCTLTIAFEQGGRAHFQDQAVLVLQPEGWTLQPKQSRPRPRSPHSPQRRPQV